MFIEMPTLVLPLLIGLLHHTAYFLVPVHAPRVRCTWHPYVIHHVAHRVRVGRLTCRFTGVPDYEWPVQ